MASDFKISKNSHVKILVLHKILISYIYIVVLSVNTSVLSIKFCLKKQPQPCAKHCGMYEAAESTKDADSKSARNEFAF